MLKKILLTIFLFLCISNLYSAEYGEKSIRVFTNTTNTEDFPTIDRFRVVLWRNKGLHITFEYSDYNGTQLYPSSEEDSYGFQYQNITKHEQIRVIGGVYKIANIEEDEKSPIVWLELNEKIPAKENTFILPIAVLEKYEDSISPDLDMSGLHFGRMVACITKEDLKQKQPKLTFKFYGAPLSVSPIPLHSDKLEKQTPVVGDLLWVGNCGHKVTKIVLPDPAIKLRGWVEIEQEFIAR